MCLLGALLCLCGVLGHLAPVHQCARSVRCFASAVSWATWLLFTGAPAQCVVLRVRCPGPLRSCLPVCPLVVLFCLCGVLGNLAPVHGCARSVRCLCVRCPGPLGSCSPVCPLGVLCCVCGVLGHLAPVQRCARLVRCFACAVSLATWLPFTGVPARRAVLRVRCPGPLGSCSPVCPLYVLFCVCRVLGHLAPVHRFALSLRCFTCAVSGATWLLFTDVPARRVALRVCCPGPLGSCSPVCPLRALLPVCGVLGHLAPGHRCARSVCCFASAVSWATWLLFTSVPAQSVAMRVRCPWPLGSCSPVCPLGLLCCLRGVLGDVAPVHRCARSVRCLCVRCPGPFGSCSPVCPLGELFRVCIVLGHLVPVHLCARTVCCVACAVSWATWLLFTGVPARCVVLRVRCPGPVGSCSPVRWPGVLCGVLNPFAPVHRCARLVCCAVGYLCGTSLRHAHWSIRKVAIRIPQGLGTLLARTHPSARRLFVAGRGRVPSRRTRVHPDGGCCVAGRGRVRCGGRTRSSRRRLVLLRTCPRAVVRCLLCALSGLAAPGGRRCLAPVRVPLWRASWPRVVRRASSSLVALGAPVGFPDAVVPSLNPGAGAPGFTGWLRGARGGRLRTGRIVPAAGPRRGRGAGLTLRCTCSVPCDGVVPGGSLRRRSWVACAAVVGVCGPGH